LLAVILLGCDNEKSEKKDEGKGAEVDLGGLKAPAPAKWKEEEVPESSRQMRYKQFRLPRAEGDKEDPQLIIFFLNGQGGGTKENIERWKGMFNPPEGKKIDDVAKVSEMKVGDVPVTYLDLEGTYKYKAAPFAPNAEVTLKPDFRMLAVVFDCPKGPYYLRLTGPAKSVAEQKKAFDDWLKAFK
jgi:hypothetical protein